MNQQFYSEVVYTIKINTDIHADIYTIYNNILNSVIHCNQKKK